MTIVLDGRPYASVLKKKLQQQTQEIFGHTTVYMAIIFVGDNPACAAYVGFKKQFGEDIGIAVEIFGQDTTSSFDHLTAIKTQALSGTSQDIVSVIQFLNADPLCVGIIIQLPLPDSLRNNTAIISKHIDPKKDIDAMGGVVYGMNSFAMIDFLGATPQAAMTLLQQYNLDNVSGKMVSIIGQSNLIGKPLATQLMKKGATVLSFNSKSPKDQMYRLCQQSSYIFSCTGVIHLVDNNYINNEKNQIIVDIGYGYKDGKPVGDVQLDIIKDRVAAYTPIPGGVGPLTVASLFANIFTLRTYFD